MYSKTGNNYKSAGRRVISMVLAIALICSFGLTSVFAEGGATAVIDSGEVTKVKVSPLASGIPINGTRQLTATVTGGITKEVTWKSSDETIAFVDMNGLVTGLKEGDVIITVTSKENPSKSDIAEVFVLRSGGSSERDLRMRGVTSVENHPNPPVQLIVRDYYDNGKDVTSTIKNWHSSNPAVATVSNTGLVTFATVAKAGETIVTATGEDEATAECTVSVIPNLNYSDLEDAIFLASAYLGSTWESDNGEEVPNNLFWVPTSAKATFLDAYDTANNSQTSTATQATINSATSALKTALNKFIANIKMGTSEEIGYANTVALTKAVISAWANLNTPANVSQIAKKTYFNAVDTANSIIFEENITQAEMDKALDTLNKATSAFNAAKTTGGGSSGGSGSGGGSSSGGGTGTPSVDRPSSNVGSTGEVKTEDIKAETSKAVADAVKAAPGATANVTVKNADNITPAALKEMAAAATKAGGKVQLMADSVVNGVIETRLYINPALASTLKAPIKLGVTLNSLEIDATKAKFASFANNIAVASFAQQGSFGMKIQVAVKLDLTKLNTKTLVFYSYDKATNKYIPIVAPAYTIDKNGYLHFSTTVGGDIIITDKALAKK